MNKTDLIFWSWILFGIFFFAYSIKIWRNRINNYVNNRRYREGKDLFSIYSEDFGLVLVKTVFIFLVTYFVFNSISHYYDNFHIDIWFAGLFIIPLTFFLTASTLHLIVYFKELSRSYPLNKDIYYDNDPMKAYKLYNENYTKSMKEKEDRIFRDSQGTLVVISLFLSAAMTSLLHSLYKDSEIILYLKKIDPRIIQFIIVTVFFIILAIIIFLLLLLFWGILLAFTTKIIIYFKKSSFDKFFIEHNTFK